jgi:ribosomal-protein-alanine N-acetyltransferase
MNAPPGPDACRAGAGAHSVGGGEPMAPDPLAAPARSAEPTPVPLGPEDLAEVAAIEALVFPEPLSLAEIVRLWARPGTRYLGVRDAQRLVAYFGFELSPPTAHVISNATHPDARRRGLGALVLGAGADVARTGGARWLLGEVRRSNTAQLSLLRRLNWQVIGVCPRFFGNGEDAYVVWHLL